MAMRNISSRWLLPALLSLLALGSLAPIASAQDATPTAEQADLFRSLSQEQQDAILRPIEGIVPSPGSLPPGCAFSPRCRSSTAVCKTTAPLLEERVPGHRVACFHPARAVA